MTRENEKKSVKNVTRENRLAIVRGPENPFPDSEIDRPLLAKGAHNLPHHGPETRSVPNTEN